MSRVVVLQTAPAARSEWIERCMNSVASWSRSVGAQYEVQDDSIRSLLPDWVWKKCDASLPAAFDLLRLEWIQSTFADRPDLRYCLWLDADTLVLHPSTLRASLRPDCEFAVGRENWVECNSNGSCKRIRRHVHNAAIWARRDNPVVPFYRFAAERILRRVERPFVPQLIGPKLLSTWHNVLQFDVLETCTMVSPDLACALLSRHESVWEAYRQACGGTPAAVNLCGSLQTDPKMMCELLSLLADRTNGACSGRTDSELNRSTGRR